MREYNSAKNELRVSSDREQACKASLGSARVPMGPDRFVRLAGLLRWIRTGQLK
jgi:hypothetical protein